MNALPKPRSANCPKSVCTNLYVRPDDGEFKSYPSPACRHISEEEGKKAYQRVRKARSRHNLTSKGQRDKQCPANPKKLPESAWKDFGYAREALASDQVNLARDKALELIARVGNAKSTEANRITLRCEEVLVDAGAIGEAQAVYNYLSRKAWAIAEGWSIQRDRLSLAQALITLSNLERVHGEGLSDRSRRRHHFRQALDLIQFAMNILVELRWRKKSDQDVVIFLLHQAIVWKTRIIVSLDAPDQASQEIGLLHSLASDIGSSSVWFETYREDARRSIELCNFTRAELCIAQMEYYLGRIQNPSAIAPMTKLRLKLDLCDKAEDYEPVESTLKEYSELWHKYPTSYHADKLGYWEKKLKERLISHQERVASPTTPILPSLYMNKAWKKRI